MSIYVLKCQFSLYLSMIKLIHIIVYRDEIIFLEMLMSTIRKYSRELYEKEVILKAAYAFTGCAFIHLDVDTKYYLISMTSKSDEPEEQLLKEFENELIAQETRRLVAEKTKNIREIIVARALSSTIINMEENDEEGEDSFNADEILTDWYE